MGENNDDNIIHFPVEDTSGFKMAQLERAAEILENNLVLLKKKLDELGDKIKEAQAKEEKNLNQNSDVSFALRSEMVRLKWEIDDTKNKLDNIRAQYSRLKTPSKKLKTPKDDSAIYSFREARISQLTSEIKKMTESLNDISEEEKLFKDLGYHEKAQEKKALSEELKKKIDDSATELEQILSGVEPIDSETKNGDEPQE